MDALGLLIQEIKAFIESITNIYIYVFFNFLPDASEEEDKNGIDFIRTEKK